MIIYLGLVWIGGALGFFVGTMIEKYNNKEKNESAFNEKNER